MLAGLIGDGHLTAVGVDDYMIYGIYSTHCYMWFASAKVVKMIYLCNMNFKKFLFEALFIR